MSMIKHFKDLTEWQKADALAHEVFTLTEGFPIQYAFDLTNQLRRAALSVPANIVEGSTSSHTKELLQAMNIARRSLRETQYFLLFALRRELIAVSQYETMNVAYEEVYRMLCGLTTSVRGKSE